MEKLFLSDKEIATRLGIKCDLFPAIAQTLEKSGFPKQDPLFEDKRYWPSVRAYLDRRQGLRQDVSGAAASLPTTVREQWT